MAVWLSTFHQVIFASYRSKQIVFPDNIQRIILKKAVSLENCQDYPEIWERIIKNARTAYQNFRSIESAFLTPDIIFYCLSNGGAFYLPQVFNKSFLVGFADPKTSGKPQVKNVCSQVQSLQFLQSKLCYFFYADNKSFFPEIIKRIIHPAPLILDTDFYTPQHYALNSKLLVFNLVNIQLNNLEHYLESALQISVKRPEWQICILVGNTKIAQQINDTIKNLQHNLKDRVNAECAATCEAWRDCLTRASLIIWPNDNDIEEQTLLQAISCCAPIMCNANVQDDSYILPLPKMPGPEYIRAILKNMDRTQALKNKIREAREIIIDKYGIEKKMPLFWEDIAREYAQWHACQK